MSIACELKEEFKTNKQTNKQTETPVNYSKIVNCDGIKDNTWCITNLSHYNVNL